MVKGGRWDHGARLAVGAALVALAGGVVGGLIVRLTWPTGSRGSTTTTVSASGTSAACPAASVADRALPSVVTIRASNAREGGSGSGVVVRSSGYILTNDHVVSIAAHGGDVSILRSDGESTNATIVGRDPLTDLAVIKAGNASGLPAISLGDSASL